jgi:chemotaxis protein methyltransferase WspC
MSLVKIENLLKDKIGLHSATVGSATVGKAVEQRMRACASADADEYYRTLVNSEAELASLIDTVVIPETWFYRDRQTFSAFRQWLREEWMTSVRDSPLRVLSVPCSTGEEPYTLAMCLADCGISPAAALVDAVDVSRRSLARAREAVYGSNSFRGDDLLYRTRHFHADGQLYRLDEDIRWRVSFENANIFDDSFIQDRAAYNVIFCRNLLIYFDRTMQHDAIDRIQRLLRKDGLLFLGHSETSLVNQRPFTALDYPSCFGFRFNSSVDSPGGRTAPPKPVRRLPQRKLPSVPRVRAPAPFAGIPAVTETPAAVSSKPDSRIDRLRQAAELADQGHMDEAAVCCEALIDEHSDLAGAYHLLGVIRDAAGNHVDAEKLFRKTIYLDPNHYEALSHLAALYAGNNQPDAASRFRERAARVHARRETNEAGE